MRFGRFLGVCLSFIAMNATGQQMADLIIVNGKVHTMDRSGQIVQAVAIASKKILAAGSQTQIMKTKGKKTTIIDAGGKTVTVR